MRWACVALLRIKILPSFHWDKITTKSDKNINSFLISLSYSSQRIPSKKSSKNISPKKFLKKNPPKKFPKKFLNKFENIQFPSSHLEAENPFGLVYLGVRNQCNRWNHGHWFFYRDLYIKKLPRSPKPVISVDPWPLYLCIKRAPMRFNLIIKKYKKNYLEVRNQWYR